MTGAVSVAGALGAQAYGSRERVVRPEFTGSATEYFRVWIVNLFFTLISLGLYSPWAKVRKKRYFYGSTRLDGDTFDYFASPKAILVGRIIAVAVFVTYAFSGELLPQSSYAFWILFVLVLPWLVVRALAFNAQNSAYRGLRFDFTATKREAIRVYIGMPILVLLSLGFAYPWFAARQKQFVVSHHAYGSSGFGCNVSVGSFFGIYLLAGLMTMLFAVPVIALTLWIGFTNALPDEYSWIGTFGPMALLYLVYAAVYGFVVAKTTNLMWNGTSGSGVRFSSTLGAGRLARLYVENLLAIAFTAGFAIPWAAVRTLRYRLENFAMIVDDESPHEANPALQRIGAAGQEIGDIFNLEVGL
jgi:uncharacterized membrane protein YjgN (DUF898 family)